MREHASYPQCVTNCSPPQQGEGVDRFIGIIADAASKHRTNRGSSLIGKKLLYRGIQSLPLARRKELWLCENERFRMRNRLPFAFFLHDFQLQFK